MRATDKTNRQLRSLNGCHFKLNNVNDGHMLLFAFVPTTQQLTNNNLTKALPHDEVSNTIS